jgi:hypothetical protein
MKTGSIVFAASILLYSAASWGEVAILKYSKIGTSLTGKPILICFYQFRGKTIKKAIPAAAGKCSPQLEIY